MTDWPRLLIEGRLLPHFQPIVSIDTQTVAAFEALGRLDVRGEVVSLGPFFHPAEGAEAPPELRKLVDRSVRKAALMEFSRQRTGEQRLFLNVRPTQMLEHLTENPGQLPWTLKTALDLGIDPQQLVIELTEEPIGQDAPRLRELIQLYRSHGCAIAVDDVGAEASNLDRIGFFEPDIIKIDSLMLRRSREERSFREVLRGVSAMAEGLGASVLFEGVESEQDLEQALSFGARYVQGWFFSRAAAEFLPEKLFQERLLPVLRRFGERLGRHSDVTKQAIRSVMVALGSPPQPAVAADGTWHFLPEELNRWTGTSCRVFLTDRTGFQVSANFENTPGGWVPNPRGLGRCRAVRPYFPGGGDNRWSVSDVYYDVNDRTLMRTYSRPSGPDLLLFVDVPEIENSALNH